MNKNKKLLFLDLFSGCGGLSLGLEKAGMQCLAGIDFLEPAIATFKKNHKHAHAICADIKNLNPKDINKLIENKKVDLICGGPPCQGFSTIGPGNADDKRNHLFLDFVRFVKFFSPKYILIENVTGLVAKKNQDTLESIFNCFNELGYKLDIRVLTASHYGVPQSRRRVIILGNNINIQNKFPKKEFANLNEKIKGLKKVRTVGWAFENLISFRNKIHNHDLESAFIKNNLEKARINLVPEGKSIRYEKDEKEYLPKELWFDHDWSKMSEKRFREARYQRLDTKKPSPTIVTNRKMYYHPSENRYLTQREAAALQSFPSNFKFCGSISKQWTQIGNAVPPVLARKIGEGILHMEENKRKKVKEEQRFDFDLIRSVAFKYDKDTYEQSKEKQLDLDINF